MARITKRTLDASRPQLKDYIVWDDDLKGVGLRVAPTGRKVYIIQYRTEGRQRRLTLGKANVLTASEARDMAAAKLGDVAKGEDPSGVLQEFRRSLDVNGLVDRFLAEHVDVRLSKHTQRFYHSACDNYIRPKLGSLKVTSVSRADVIQIHQAMSDKPYQANRVLAVISKMFTLAEVWEIRPDGTNPTRHVPKYKERPRERFLDPDELKRLWNVLEQRQMECLETPHVVAAFKLLILTGCRLAEIQTLKWSFIRGDAIWLPNAKTGPRKVLLSSAALEVLRDIERVAGNEHVIVGATPTGHVTDLEKPWRRIRVAAGLSEVRIHDLRHTYASIAGMAGHSLHMIGNLLGHTQAQTTMRYAHFADRSTRKALDEVDSVLKEVIQIG